MHLLFDIDGVLIHSAINIEAKLKTQGFVGSYPEFLQRLFADEEYNLTLLGQADIHAVMTRVLKESQQTLSADAVMEAWGPQPCRSNDALINRLGEFKCSSLSLASNQDPVRGHSIHARFSPISAIDQVFLSCDLSVRKPHAEYFEHILTVLDAPPTDVFFVDDSKPNVETAASLGITAHHFTDNPTLFDHLAELEVI